MHESEDQAPARSEGTAATEENAAKAEATEAEATEAEATEAEATEAEATEAEATEAEATEAEATEAEATEAEAVGAAEADHPKLHDIWHLVLLRGLLALALVLVVFIPNDSLLPLLGLLFGAVLVVGGLLELLMGHQLPGHPFRGILVFTGLTSTLIGAFLLYYYPANMALLVVTTGLWVALRGFAALWLGLSIVSGTFDRLLPAGAGLAALILGASAMIWLNPPSNVFANLVAVYALGAGLIQIVVALRLRNQGRKATQSQG